MLDDVKVVVPAEIRPGERRVALVPGAVPRLLAAGHEVAVQAGAGLPALAPDAAYAAAGASVVDALEGAGVDVLLHVRPLHPAFVRKLRPGAVTIGLCEPATNPAGIRLLREAGVSAFALELVPTSPQALPMDAVAAQESAAGYRAVLEVAARLPRFLPRLTTATGDVAPARVLVLGAGVAGLQAATTARRLGALVALADPRPDVAEVVRSVGGTLVEASADALEACLREADVVVATAMTRRLVTREMLAGMRPGGVVVDLRPGGAVEGCLPGEDVVVPVAGGAVTLVGLPDAASGLAADASRLFADAAANLLLHLTRDGRVVVDLADEITAATCLAHKGVVRHGATARAVQALEAARGGQPAPPRPAPAR